MTRGQIRTVVASTLVGALLGAVAPANAVTATLMRAPASSCQLISGGVFYPAGSTITANEANNGAGRLALINSINPQLEAYCPVTELPTLLDVTGTANTVSVLYKSSSASVAARAQLCSDDNAWSFGGSCSVEGTGLGTGARAIDLAIATHLDWNQHPDSLHYIFVYVPNVVNPASSSYFTGYTIWHL